MMKRTIQALLFIIVTLAAQLTGVSLSARIGPLDLDQMEAELASKPIDYTPQQAIADRYYVDVYLEEQSYSFNDTLIDQFVEDTMQGKAAILKQVHFLEDVTQFTYTHYDGENYYLIIDEIDLKDGTSKVSRRQYKNLFVLDNSESAYQVVLCSEEELTLEKLLHSTASSSLKDKFGFYPLS